MDPVLDIAGGRHPLTELAVPGQFIPNATRMGQGEGRVHVVTGGTVCVRVCARAGGRAGMCVCVCALRTDMAVTRLPAGPNASGKSCYAKQVALIAYMAHLG